MRERHESADVQLNLCGDASGVFVDEGTVGAKSRIVDQGLDREAARAEFGVELSGCGGACKIGSDRGHGDAVGCAEGFGLLVEDRFAARDQHQVRPASGKGAGELKAKSRTRTGDEGGLAGEGDGHEGVHSMGGGAVGVEGAAM